MKPSHAADALPATALSDEVLRHVAGGRATLTDLSITKTSDRSSPTLLRACATGQHLPEVKLTS